MNGQIGSRTIHPVPALPSTKESSPEIVKVFDKIRFDGRISDSDEYGEFAWFAREYPRCYRHHLECAQFRLRSMHSLASILHGQLASNLNSDDAIEGVSIGDVRVKQIYWDFESYLSAINNALDLLARISGTAYQQSMPPSFNKICKNPSDSGPIKILRRAKQKWVNRLKDYRDCFTHYTPVDTILSVGLVQYSDGFHFRAKLPTNPNVRDILGFRFSRRVELLRYACSVWRHLIALDRAVAFDIRREYQAGNYPKKISNLFFVGRRQRTK